MQTALLKSFVNFKKHIFLSLLISGLALVILLIDFFLSRLMEPMNKIGFCWIAYLSWALYFIVGKTLKGSAKVLFSFLVGILTTLIIIQSVSFFSSQIETIGILIELVLIVFSIYFLKKITIVSLLPALYIGAGIYFVFINFVQGATYENAFIV